MTEPITIIIADDHPLFRRGLLEVLERESGFRIVAEAADGNSALALIERQAPDIALLDVSMPGLTGLDVAERMRSLGLRSKVVLLTMYREAAVLRRALDAGVRGYVLKDSAVMEIVACLYTVAAGRAYISPALSTELLDRRTELFSPAARAITALTPAELPVLRLIARGHTSAEIAAALGKSVKTIENQRSHICQKIGLSGPQALLRFALENKTILTAE
jgi:DNA-binding NarL/FixJ family response regulator